MQDRHVTTWNEVWEWLMQWAEGRALAYGHWKATRALRMPSPGLNWQPAPIGLKRRIRQAWCFLWRHDEIMVFDPIEDDFDEEHPGVTVHCRRCGLRWGYCLLHDGKMAAEEWEPE